MQNKRNLDIAKIDKPSAHPHSPDHVTGHRVIRHPAPKRLGYFRLLGQSWKAVFDSNIFQLSLLRNLLSVRALLIALIPFVFFQLRYFLVLKPDQILERARSLFDPQNSSILITSAGLILAVVLISFLADSVISPALLRYNFQKLGKRKVKMYQSLADSMSLSYGSIAQRILKFLVFIVFASFVLALFYGAYVFGYGSISEQISYISVVAAIAIIILSLYFCFKYWLQASFAIGSKGGRSKIAIPFDRVFKHPINSIGMGLNWLVSLAVFASLGLGVAALEIYFVEITSSIMSQLLILAAGTTLVYLIWTIWMAWQSGYWSSIVEHYATTERLEFEVIPEPRYWQFVSLVIILLLVVVGFIIFSYMNADRLINLLQDISNRIPANLNINLPKP